MNTEEYHNIVHNLKDQPNYELKDGILYRIEDDKLLQVIRRFELEGVMYMMHDHPMSAHFGIEATYQRIKEKYY